MDIEKLPTVEPRDFGSRVDPAHPILSLRWAARGPHRVPGHAHPRAQIIYQLEGVYRVNTAAGNFVVPRHQAIWIPSHLLHETFTNDSAEALMFFVDEACTVPLPPGCMVVSVGPLLGALFERAVENGNDYDPDDAAARLLAVILDELRRIEPAPFKLPLARDKRLRRIMDKLLADPADHRGLDELCIDCGASERTVARLFRDQTGMSFHEWRTQLRLLEAIDRLGQGRQVTDVAADLGYRSPSAFIAMFRRALGVSPGHYR
jgi:AraC-like DNA-binding protein